jgi:hypothetical protein
VTVLIGHGGAHMRGLHAAGQPLPPPVTARGLIDTGTDITAVVPSIVQSLGLIASNTVQTQTPSGRIQVSLYQVSLSIVYTGPTRQPSFFRASLTVTDLPQNFPNEDVLLGMNVLNQLVFTLDGPTGQFHLTY